MSQTKQQHAYQRGVRVARFWKKVKGSVLYWDRRCVVWANKKRIPSWVGHIPVVFLFAISIVTCLAGGLLFVGIVILIWAILLLPSIMGAIKPTANLKVTNWEEKSHHFNYGSNGSNGSNGSTGS